MKIIAFFLAITFCYSFSGPKDYLLAVPTAGKVGLAGYVMVGSVFFDEPTLASATLGIGLSAMYGLPNVMLLKSLGEKNGSKITYWRKYVIYQESILYSIIFTKIFVDTFNDFGRDSKFQTELDLEINEMLGTTFLIIGTPFLVAYLLNYIPYSFEKIQPQVNVSFVRDLNHKLIPQTAFNLSLQF